MSTKAHGCRECEHDVWQGGDRVCRLKPHDYRTPEQRAIVEWLKQNGKDAFAAPFWTCPSFRHHDEAGAEIDKVRAVFSHGAEDDRWRPGETAVDALIREHGEQREALRVAHEALANMVRRCKYDCTRESYCGLCEGTFSVLPKDYDL